MCSKFADNPEEHRRLTDIAKMWRLVHRTRFLWVRDHLVGKRVSADTKDANRLWRSKDAQQWDFDDPHDVFLEKLGIPPSHRGGRVPGDFNQNRAEVLQELAACAKASKESAAAELERAFAVDDLGADKANAAALAEKRRLDKAWNALARNLPRLPPPPSDKPPAVRASVPVISRDTNSKKLLDRIKKVGAFVPPAPLPARGEASRTDTNASAARVAVGPAHTQLRSIMERKERPNEGQHAILTVIADFIDARVRGESPAPPRIFMHGPGGTGKSFTLSCIDELFAAVEQHVVPCALTGVACAAISCRDPASTLHTTCQLDAETMEIRKSLTAAETAFMTARFRNCGLLAVDEISFTTVRTLAGIAQRLQLLRPEQPAADPFRGLPIILSGDLHQLPSVSGKLYDAYFDDSADYDSTKRSGQASLRGAALLKTFRLMQLTQQMRCDDARHVEKLDGLRSGNMTGMAEYFGEHWLTAQDYVDDPSWADAMVICATNAEVDHINIKLAERRADSTGQSIVEWELDFCATKKKKRHSQKKGSSAKPAVAEPSKGAASVKLDDIRRLHGDDFVEHLYEDNADLTFRFLAGAPCRITDNINPSLGIANGAACEMHSLTFADKDLAAKTAALESRAPRITLPRGCRPTHVNVRLIGPDAEKKPAERAAWVASFASFTLVPGDVVIPIPLERRPKPTTARGRGGKKLSVAISRPAVGLAFAGTIHKAQGASRDKIILSFATMLEIDAVYVGASRVRTGAGLRIIAPFKRKVLSDIAALRPSPRRVVS